MTFDYSAEWLESDSLQRVLNAGLFYTLIHKKSGRVLSHHYTAEDAKRAKTRKSCVMLTRNLTNYDGINDGQTTNSKY